MQIFLNYIIKFCKALVPYFPLDGSNVVNPLVSIYSYIFFYQADNSTLMTYSTFDGNSDSTSFFTLLNKNGLRTLCNLLIIMSYSSSLIPTSFSLPPILLKGIENHFSKSSQEGNTLGNKKFRSAHNSGRLFCSGVPVNRSLLSEEY